MKKSLYMAAFTAALLSSLSMNVARAEGDDDSLTKYGITFYGLLDIGVAYQTYGAPTNGSYVAGNEWVISKNSNTREYSVAPNGLSQSKLGIMGDENIAEGLSAVFKLELQYSPESGQLGDGPGTLVQNSGVTAAQQSSNGDSSRAGQIFGGAAYAGLKSDSWGTLTFGRQNALLLDNVLSYDPMGASYAFSVIGYSGTTAGGGDTEDARMDSSFKYANKFGPARLALMGKLGGYGNAAGNAYQADLGTDMAGFSVDVTYSHINNAIAASSTGGAINATISDNTAYGVGVKYTMGGLKLLGGFEHIGFQNPGTTFDAGQVISVGGLYTVNGTVNQAAYDIEKTLNIFWAGLNYDLNSTAKIMAAWYHISQNSYNANGCTDNSSGSCSGSENAFSLVADNAYTKHFDVYAGLMYTSVSDGLAAGFLHDNTLNAMVGMRIKF